MIGDLLALVDGLLDDRGVAIAVGAIAVVVILAGARHPPTWCRWRATFARREAAPDVWDARAARLLEEARETGWARRHGVRIVRHPAGRGWVVEARGSSPFACSSDGEAVDEIARLLRPRSEGGVR